MMEINYRYEIALYKHFLSQVLHGRGWRVGGGGWKVEGAGWRVGGGRWEVEGGVQKKRVVRSYKTK